MWTLVYMRSTLKQYTLWSGRGNTWKLTCNTENNKNKKWSHCILMHCSTLKNNNNAEVKKANVAANQPVGAPAVLLRRTIKSTCHCQPTFWRGKIHFRHYFGIAQQPSFWESRRGSMGASLAHHHRARLWQVGVVVYSAWLYPAISDNEVYSLDT